MIVWLLEADEDGEDDVEGAEDQERIKKGPKIAQDGAMVLQLEFG